MAKKQSKPGVSHDEVVREIPLACSNEQAAVEFFERHRWGDAPCCPHCGDVDVYQMTDRKTGERSGRFLWRCKSDGCRKQFTVRIGTVMEESRIPLRHWCMALWLACSSKKGCSAKQIERMTGLSYKSALFLMHRIRFAMAPANKNDGGKLTGIVEADETFIGGKPRKRYHRTMTNRGKRKSPNHDTIKDRKVAVFGAVERKGRVKVQVVPDVTAKSLRPAIEAHVEKSARLMTDENISYRKLGLEFADHQTVAHSRWEYVRGDVTTNTIESFWAILKRGIYGVYHNVSRKHLQRYLDEFEFRYNTRKMDDGERTIAAIKGAVGKRLAYSESVV